MFNKISTPSGQQHSDRLPFRSESASSHSTLGQSREATRSTEPVLSRDEDIYVPNTAPGEARSDKTKARAAVLTARLPEPNGANTRGTASRSRVPQQARHISYVGSTNAAVGASQQTESISKPTQDGDRPRTEGRGVVARDQPPTTGDLGKSTPQDCVSWGQPPISDDTTGLPNDAVQVQDELSLLDENLYKTTLEPLTKRPPIGPRINKVWKRLADSRAGRFARGVLNVFWKFVGPPLFTAFGIGLILFHASRGLLNGALYVVRHPLDSAGVFIKTLGTMGIKLVTALVMSIKAVANAAVHPKKTGLAIVGVMSSLATGTCNVAKNFFAWAKEHPWKATGLVVGCAAMFTFAFYVAPIFSAAAAAAFAGWGMSPVGAAILATATAGALTAGCRSLYVHATPMVTEKDPWNGEQLATDVNMSSFFGFFGFAHAAALTAVTAMLNIGWFALLAVNYVFLVGYEMAKDYVQVTLRKDIANDPKEFKDIWLELLGMETLSNFLRCIPGLEAHFGLEVTGDVVGTIIYDRIINARNKAELPPEEAFPNPEDADTRELLGKIQNATSEEQLGELAQELGAAPDEKTERAAILRQAMKSAKKRVAESAETLQMAA